MTLWYLSHPEVVIDPQVPVPEWGLSAVGRARVERAAALRPWRPVARIVCSAETKAVETAQILAAASGATVEVRPDTGENDRSATGFVPPDEFERVADAFFARPQESVRGWETAAAAQTRITGALADLLTRDDPTDLVVVGHGGVGTLWACHLAGAPIARAWDQAGAGHVLAVDRGRGRLLHRWRPLEEVTVAA